ncbi:hypothetical protein MJD09_13655, partial [bacterium]|nr:hypothetical protein [bacterium]
MLGEEGSAGGKVFADHRAANAGDRPGYVAKRVIKLCFAVSKDRDRAVVITKGHTARRLIIGGFFQLDLQGAGG